MLSLLKKKNTLICFFILSTIFAIFS